VNVFDEKVGLSVAGGAVVRFESVATDDGARVTTNEYVCVVVPSCAVTTVVIVLVPTFKAMLPDAEPEATVVPLTFIVAVGSVVVGVSCNVDVAKGTLSV
jgi:hypothetical protein